MMHAPEKFRVKGGKMGTDSSYGNNGYFHIPKVKAKDSMIVVASDGEGWEHVSVSTQYRAPTWDEMCEVKHLFWDEEDLVIQYHPKKSEYVNNHKYTLHLWKPIGKEVPTPPSILVGFK